MYIYYEHGQEMIVCCWFKNKPKNEVISSHSVQLSFKVLRILSKGLHSSQVSIKFKKPTVSTELFSSTVTNTGFFFSRFPF